VLAISPVSDISDLGPVKKLIPSGLQIHLRSVKIVDIISLIDAGRTSRSAAWKRAKQHVVAAIAKVVWPPDNNEFCIRPESGKERNQGNGVKPIKLGLIAHLRDCGWVAEAAVMTTAQGKVGRFDAVLATSPLPIVVEWETGNISSSHRSLNKMSLCVINQYILGGILIVPSRQLYKFLTDRIGNIAELNWYLPLWRSLQCDQGVLQIIVVEHDSTSSKVARIPKGTDGRALV
jgi:hypothetical protein